MSLSPQLWRIRGAKFIQLCKSWIFSDSLILLIKIHLSRCGEWLWFLLKLLFNSDLFTIINSAFLRNLVRVFSILNDLF